MSNGYELLDRRIQRYLHDEKWTGLRDAQERAVEPILACKPDVIISASTASGKTEAAFLPALTHIAKDEPVSGLIVYISPLIALINDQFSRMERLCEYMEIPVHPWHGDISQSTKEKFIKSPCGVLLITPESLEAQFCRRGTSVARLFGQTQFIVVDELHAFIGTERGKQLQSLMDRLEFVLRRRVPRIGLSATIGDLKLAAHHLRHNDANNIVLIESESKGSDLQMLVKGYEYGEGANTLNEGVDSDNASVTNIAVHIFNQLHGTNNLIFPNTKRDVEQYTTLLNDLCEQNGFVKEFWPHHGSLSKELREETERALKNTTRPASAVCTNTLELGIDIGPIKCVVGIGAPCAVSSLWQRLGRSGRRAGQSKMFRGYCLEKSLSGELSIDDQLRLNTLQMIAMLELLLAGWCEPPKAKGLHYSTFVHQILAVVASYGGVSIDTIYRQLIMQGAFPAITKNDFLQLLKTMNELELIVQEDNPDSNAPADLLLGKRGEQITEHYSFYAVFTAPEEYTLFCDGRQLGSMPISNVVSVEQRLLFGGRRWEVKSVDETKKHIDLKPARGGLAPKFDGGQGKVHRFVRAKMRELLSSADEPQYLDKNALEFLRQARRYFKDNNLGNAPLIIRGNAAHLLTWLGDAENEALMCLLQYKGAAATVADYGIELKIPPSANDPFDFVLQLLGEIRDSEMPSAEDLLAKSNNLMREKYDWALPKGMLMRGYVNDQINLEGAKFWLQNNIRQRVNAED